jgi:hypothetical protein
MHTYVAGGAFRYLIKLSVRAHEIEGECAKHAPKSESAPTRNISIEERMSDGTERR